MNLIVDWRGSAHKVQVPDALPNGIAVPVSFAGTTLNATWFKREGVLALSDGNGVERMLRVRSVSVQKDDEGEAAVAAEIVTGGGVHVVRANVRADIPGQRAKGPGAGLREQVVRSQITGKVLQVLVAVGDRVEAGQALLVVEAMKMENRVFAQAAGQVHKISVQANDAVQTGKELLRIAP